MSYARAGEYLHKAIEQGLVTLDAKASFRRLTEAHPRAYHTHVGVSLFDTIPINPCQELHVINPLSDVEEV